MNAAPGFSPNPEPQSTDSEEIARLRAKNELWKVYAPEWELYLSAYEGGKDFASTDNLWKHQRENTEDYNDRAKRVTYWNYCELLVDFFTNFVYAETIQREGGANQTWYDAFIKDVNRKGDSITDYMRKVSDDMQIFGVSYTLVDTPRTGLAPDSSQPLTKQQEKDLGIRPYWVLLHPDEVTDWVKDDFGAYQYLKRLQLVDEPSKEGVRHYEQYTEWFLKEIVVSRVDITNPARPTLVSAVTYPNELGYIPIHATLFRESKKNRGMGNSFLRDFAHSSRRILNLTSLLDEFLYRQCFNMLAKQTDTAISLQDQEDNVTGSSNVIEYPKGADAPQYLSPPSEPAKFIQDERQREINEMFRRAAQDTVNELFNGEKSSGFSQAQSFSKTVPFIATRADTLEKCENALMTITMKVLGKEWDGKVKYKDRYELTNVTDAITQLTSVFRDLMIPSESFVKEELKRLVREIDGKITPEVMAKILKEIEAMDFPGWQETQKLALIGNAGKSPAAQQKDKSTGTVAEAAAEARAPGTATKKLRK
jgi:hypothetical protein